MEQRLGCAFNSVLVNLNRDGNDYVGWHADDERELGATPLIVSLSLGACRPVGFRHKTNVATELILVESGLLLRMNPAFQQHWMPCVPAPENPVGARINLTFRHITPPT